jgi:hypothetical protein
MRLSRVLRDWTLETTVRDSTLVSLERIAIETSVVWMLRREHTRAWNERVRERTRGAQGRVCATRVQAADLRREHTRAWNECALDEGPGEQRSEAPVRVSTRA